MIAAWLCHVRIASIAHAMSPAYFAILRAVQVGHAHGDLHEVVPQNLASLSDFSMNTPGERP